VTDSANRLAAAFADRYRIERELGQGSMATWALGHGDAAPVANVASGSYIQACVP
jgi:hypothetical protein